MFAVCQPAPRGGFVGPPPVVAPGAPAPAPVTAPAPGAAPSAGRAIVSNVGRAIVGTLLAPAAVILALPSTVQAPAPATAGPGTTTTTDEEQDRDPFVGVYRVAGGSSEINGVWWTPVIPTSVQNYRGAAALPPTNTGETLVIGSVRNSNIVYRGIAAPQPQWGHPGGAIEYRVVPGSVIIHGTLPLRPRL